MRFVERTRVAFVGCGFVADYYVATMPNHERVEVAGAFDRDAATAERFTTHHRLRRYRSLDELLDDPAVQVVVNLTNPRSHHEVSRAALLRGKHVYSEKPLATALEDAERLVELAESRGLLLSSAPCTLLGEAAQTLWKALREERIGVPRLAYAEMDDGPIPLERYGEWRSLSGAPWPARDEFEVGCTLEHSGYVLTWLAAMFGPVRTVTAAAAIVKPDKGVPLEVRTPDFTVATLLFHSGMVARLTCGIFASMDRRLRVFGDQGVLSVDDTWNFASPVRLASRGELGLKAEKHPRLARLVGLGPRRVRPVRRSRFAWSGRPANHIDFARGVADLAEAARSGAAPRLSARFCLHVNELALTIQDPAAHGCPRDLRTRFEPVAPMPWAG